MVVEKLATNPNPEKKSKPKSKVKAPPKPKVISEEKLMEQAVKLVFFSPTSRRQPFLYRGFIADYNYYTVGSAPEKEMVFANPNQSIGVIEITDPDIKRKIDLWLMAFGVTTSELEVVLMAAMASISSKAKWDLSKIELRPQPDGAVNAIIPEDPTTECLVRAPMESIFTLNVLVEMRAHVLSMLKSPQACFVYPYRQDDPDATIIRFRIAQEAYANSPIAKVFSGDIQGILTRGVDIYDVRSLDKVEVSYDQSLIFKLISGHALCYGALLSTPVMRQVISRIHVFMIPCK